ncbi:MAG: hypothetical protein K0R08_216 [Solimicrobium sp.]|jgi:hypothetical protein|nr:hypothetical protein [Solimicrobium sp.]
MKSNLVISKLVQILCLFMLGSSAFAYEPIICFANMKVKGQKDAPFDNLKSTRFKPMQNVKEDFLNFLQPANFERLENKISLQGFYSTSSNNQTSPDGYFIISSTNEGPNILNPNSMNALKIFDRNGAHQFCEQIRDACRTVLNETYRDFWADVYTGKVGVSSSGDWKDLVLLWTESGTVNNGKLWEVHSYNCTTKQDIFEAK